MEKRESEDVQNSLLVPEREEIEFLRDYVQFLVATAFD